MNKTRSSGESREKAKAAANKKAALGEDIDLSQYVSDGEEHKYQPDPSQLPRDARDRMLSAGIILNDSSQRSGTFIQMDNTPIHSSVRQEGIEVMAFSRALEKYDWLSDYLWKAVAVDSDKYTANVELKENDGYFIRALPGQKSVLPVQACLYLAQAQLMQNVHNIIIAEEGSELHIITGCATAPREEPGMHIGVSEFYVKRGAKVTFTMIHNWNP
jgi:Fe-S cluster assembly scaffold protein SufB